MQPKKSSFATVPSVGQGTVKSKGTTNEPSKWLPASIAPAEELLEVCIINNGGDVHPFMFPCCKNEIEWVDPLSRNRMDIQPTHWRKLSPPLIELSAHRLGRRLRR
jgi:hypothetical protein